MCQIDNVNCMNQYNWISFRQWFLQTNFNILINRQTYQRRVLKLKKKYPTEICIKLSFFLIYKLTHFIEQNQNLHGISLQMDTQEY